MRMTRRPQSGGVTMSQIIAFLKTRKAYSLYLFGFAMLYFLFLFFELRKGQYINANSLENIINAEQYNYLLGISKITTNLEYMMTLLFSLCLIGALFNKSRGVVTFIKVNYTIILILFLLGYLLSTSSSTPLGNNTQALVLPFTMTSLVLILYSALWCKKRLYR